MINGPDKHLYPSYASMYEYNMPQFTSKDCSSYYSAVYALHLRNYTLCTYRIAL